VVVEFVFSLSQTTSQLRTMEAQAHKEQEEPLLIQTHVLKIYANK